MNTTENISLAGYAFVIETDACNELESYLSGIRTAFSADSSAEEIVADIEERIAELLRERCVSGMVVDLNMVLDIKKRIGDPQELAQEEIDPVTEHSENPEKKQRSWKGRHLYRNLEDRVFGGVCSGLGTYFGIDKVIFRIIFLIFFCIGFAGLQDGPYIMVSVLAYLCLWIAMPAARTAEQKREMKGRPLNLNNYKSGDFDFEREVKEAVASPAGQTAKRAGGIFLGLLLLIIGLGGLLGCIFIPSLPTIIESVFTEQIQQWGPLDPGEQLGSDLAADPTFWGLVLIMVGLLCIWFLYNGVMLLFNLNTPTWRPGLILFIAWVLSIFVLIAWILKTVAAALPMIV